MEQTALETSPATTLSRFEQMKLSAAAMTLTAVALLAPNSAALLTEDDSRPVTLEAASAVHERQSIPDIAIASYNILGANHTQLGHEVGGTVKARGLRVVRFMLGKAGVRAPDIAGFQEIEPVQRHLFDKQLHKDYASVPKDKSAENPIFYNKDRFDLLRTGVVRYPYYGDTGLRAHNGKAIWARFEDKKTGQKISVINEHPVAWNQNRGSDKGGALKREKTAHIISKWVRKVMHVHPDEAVFDIGDMNSINMPLDYFDPYFVFQFKDRVLGGNRNRIGYCIKATKETGLQDSRDVLTGHTGHCPNRKRGPAYRHQIDWIYLNPKATDVKSWRVISNTITRHASDHLPVVAITQALPEALDTTTDPVTSQRAVLERRRQLAMQHRLNNDRPQYAVMPSYRHLHRSFGPDH